MAKENVILIKSYAFAIKIVKFYTSQLTNQEYRDLMRQLLRCGTSIGANVEDAAGAQTKKDFNAKMHIAYKEAREAHYWLRLLQDAEVVQSSDVKSLMDDGMELRKILGAITKKSQETE